MISVRLFSSLAHRFSNTPSFNQGCLSTILTLPGTTTLQSTQELWIDFDKRRAITIEGKDGVFTLTTISDLANVVVRAIDYAGEWPVIGGVHGTTVSSSQISRNWGQNSKYVY
jgi:hypothetical protein